MQPNDRVRALVRDDAAQDLIEYALLAGIARARHGGRDAGAGRRDHAIRSIRGSPGCSSRWSRSDSKMLEGLNMPIVMAVAGCGAASALIDMRTRRVPNPLTLGIAVTGLALAATRWSGLTVTGAALGLAVGVALMLPAYVFGAMGGGDLKLFAALGTFLGPRPTVAAFFYTLMVGGRRGSGGGDPAATAARHHDERGGPRDGRRRQRCS